MLYCSTGLHTAQWDSHHHQIESLEHSRKKDEISHSFLTTYLCTTHRYIVTIRMTRHRHRSDLSGCCRRSIKSSQLYSPSNPTWLNREKSRVLCQKVYVKLPWTPISSFCYFSFFFLLLVSLSVFCSLFYISFNASWSKHRRRQAESTARLHNRRKKRKKRKWLRSCCTFALCSSWDE